MKIAGENVSKTNKHYTNNTHTQTKLTDRKRKKTRFSEYLAIAFLRWPLFQEEFRCFISIFMLMLIFEQAEKEK